MYSSMVSNLLCMFSHCMVFLYLRANSQIYDCTINEKITASYMQLESMDVHLMQIIQLVTVVVN